MYIILWYHKLKQFLIPVFFFTTCGRALSKEMTALQARQSRAFMRHKLCHNRNQKSYSQSLD